VTHADAEAPNERTCALCEGHRASRKGEHVIPRWLRRRLFPVEAGPYSTLRNGAVERQFDHLPPRLLPVCDESTGGTCQQTLSARFERSDTTRDAVARMFERGHLVSADARSAALWWLKTALLWNHPCAYDAGDIDKPSWPEPIDHQLFRWTADGADPPSDVSLWISQTTTAAHSEAAELPRRHDEQIEIPSYRVLGEQIVSHTSVFGVAGLQLHLLHHPGWIAAHPLEKDGLAVRLWPWAGGSLDMGVLPPMDAPNLRCWLDLWGVDVRLLLASGFDPRHDPWTLAPGWFWSTSGLGMTGVIGGAA
jgi:hypothetical protein